MSYLGAFSWWDSCHQSEFYKTVPTCTHSYKMNEFQWKFMFVFPKCASFSALHSDEMTAFRILEQQCNTITQKIFMFFWQCQSSFLNASSIDFSPLPLLSFWKNTSSVEHFLSQGELNAIGVPLTCVRPLI